MKKWLIVFAILVIALAFTSFAWAAPSCDERDCSHSGGAVPTPIPTAAPQPAEPASTAEPPADEAPAPSCPTVTQPSDDFYLFYVACNESLQGYWAPDAVDAQSIATQGTYPVRDRGCFNNGERQDCVQINQRPNWYLTDKGWLNYGPQSYESTVPDAAPTSSAPVSNAPTQSGSIYYNIAYFNYLTNSTAPESQSTPGTVTLSSGSGYVTWVVTKDGQVIQGPTTFNVQAGTTQFNIYWQWPGVPVNLVTGVPDDDEIPTVVMEATLYAADGTQLYAAPAVSVTYQYQPPLGPGEPSSRPHRDGPPD